jgi:PPOX class probable FMN-dependent enzyme
MWVMEINDQIVGKAALRELYRTPSALAVAKQFDSIDSVTATFIDRCPFLVLSTTDGNTVDASPRGGPPGFLQRLDDRHIAIPDLNGNNRLDSLENIAEHGRAGLLLFMPGTDDTVRINGPAILTTDSRILDGFTAELRRPKLAIVVETAELYAHCAKAFRRSQMWQPDTWGTAEETPDLADIVGAQLDMKSGEMRTALEASYAADLAADRADRAAD